MALSHLGTLEAWSLEAWSLGLPDAERPPPGGRRPGPEDRPAYLEVACLAQLGIASKARPMATTRRRCQEAIALAERHGWATDPVIAPALVTLGAAMIWTGDLDQGERWVQRTTQALQTDTGPGITRLLHLATGMLHGFMDPAPARYTIRINGHLGATARSAFPAMVSRQHGADTRTRPAVRAVYRVN